MSNDPYEHDNRDKTDRNNLDDLGRNQANERRDDQPDERRHDQLDERRHDRPADRGHGQENDRRHDQPNNRHGNRGRNRRGSRPDDSRVNIEVEQLSTHPVERGNVDGNKGRRQEDRRDAQGSPNDHRSKHGHLDDGREPQGRRDEGREPQGRRDEDREPQGRRDEGRDGQGRRGGRRRPSHGPSQRQDGSPDRLSGTVTVVIPLLNEEESLPELASRLEQVLERVAPRGYDVIFIDDGSTDRSYAVLRDINTRNHRFKAIRFRRNYGKSAALAVGFAEAKGDYVITMDADLQDDPSEIPSLLTKLSDGFDLVSGWKRKRHDPWHKTLPSKLFNAVTSAMSGLKLHDFNCGLKAYRREVVETVQVYGEMHRYIPALAHWEGFRVTEIPVQHHARKFGVSKFGMSRFLKGFLDLLTVMFTTRFVKRPLHFFGAVGALLAAIGFLTDLYLAIEWFLEKTSLSNRPLALFGVAMIIVGVQLISIGLIGELIVKNNLERLRYSIRERLT